MAKIILKINTKKLRLMSVSVLFYLLPKLIAADPIVEPDGQPLRPKL